MKRIVLQVLVNALALWIAAWILPGVAVVNTGTSGLDTSNATVNKVLAFVFIGLVFGVVNALVKPVVKILSLPVTILTLGLFTIVINAAMLWLTSWLSSYTPVHFTIDHFFWTAVLAALIISLVSMLMGGLTRSRARR
ncbi:phage holin family protein [Arthrobacter wenxiniae]|jgi:putative membrane protein|uniref:Phage holin family protein n=1 Tax=Arthrobacter wenxiniae TaxID=2713570 RepID=A0A7Y7LZZ3_9MICC|nr:phage holin family protein [Arthrobacter wenxiniae]NVM96502.1 phage holin family protein [Arthrobacter wenxiniae]